MHGSPETSTQKKHHAAPVYYKPFQSENSAFDRVYKQPNPGRQPIHGFIQPANVAHTPKVVSRTQSDNVMVSAFTTSLRNPRAVNEAKVDKTHQMHQGLTNTFEPYKTETSNGKLHDPFEESPRFISSYVNKMKSDEVPPPKDALPYVSQNVLPQNKPHVSPGKAQAILYLQSGLSPQAYRPPGQAKEVSTMKHKMLVRSMSDSGTQKSETIQIKDSEVQTEMVFLGTEENSDMANGEAGTVNTKVSVAQLRTAFLETANSSKKADPWVTFAHFFSPPLIVCDTCTSSTYRTIYS